MMKLILLPAIVLGCAFLATAQPNEEIVAYFNRNWNPVYDSTAEIAYFRTVERKDGYFIVRDYDIAQKLRMKAECSAYQPRLIRNGNATYYYENGKIEEEGRFKDDKRTGVFHYFYKTGKPKEDLEYQEYDEVRHLTFFTETGEPLITDGNGTIREPGTKGVQYTKVRNYLAVASYTIMNPNDTVYSLMDKMPEYRGGTDQLMADIKRTIRYPRSAVMNGVEGTVYVSFIVTRTGDVEDVGVIKGFNEECDMEAMRVASFLDGWQPGMLGGRPVNTRFVLPFKFTLPRSSKKK